MANEAAATIRLAEAADAIAIAGVHVAAWHASYAGILPDGMLAAQSVEARAASWTRMLAQPQAASLEAVLVAQAGAEIVGFLACGPQRDRVLLAQGFDAEIGSIYLRASHQRRGIGRRLMQAGFAALDEASFAAASLWVLRENHPACRFYDDLGGRIVARKDDRRGPVTLAEIAYGWSSLSALH